MPLVIFFKSLQQGGLVLLSTVPTMVRMDLITLSNRQLNTIMLMTATENLSER